MIKILSKRAFSLIELSIVVLIIGILISGITAGSRLVRDSKLKSAAQLTKASDVNSISDLVLWLEPTLENSFAVGTATSFDDAVNHNLEIVKNISKPDDLQQIARWNDINPKISNGLKKVPLNIS